MQTSSNATRLTTVSTKCKFVESWDHQKRQNSTPPTNNKNRGGPPHANYLETRGGRRSSNSRFSVQKFSYQGLFSQMKKKRSHAARITVMSLKQATFNSKRLSHKRCAPPAQVSLP